MNWWKRFKIGNQLSNEEKTLFLDYLKLDQSLPVDVHCDNATSFPSIQFDYKQTLINAYIPSEQSLQWAGFYLMQASNRFGITTNKQYEIDQELFNVGVTFAKELQQYSHLSIICIVDLPTIQLLSFAMGAKEICEPIINFDTLPHPFGISSSSLALELLYQWKNEFNSKNNRDIPLLLLDSNRLVNYSDNPLQFDNRSTAKLPTIESLKLKKIESIFYVTDSEMDLDDVHEDFCYYVNAGISILWFNTQAELKIKEKQFVKRSTMFSKRTSFINKV